MSEPTKTPDELSHTELLRKVNDLTEALERERIGRLRIEKTAQIQAKWNSFIDDGKVDLDSVLWTLTTYQPPVADAKTNSPAPPTPPTGGNRKLHTPAGYVDASAVPASYLAHIGGQTSKDGF